jgi:NDP-sugar pyrophosphorylase family protein
VRAFFGDEPVLLVNGDVLFDFDLTALVRAFRRGGARACLGLLPNPDPRRYTPVYTNEKGRIVTLGDGRSSRRARAQLFTGIQMLDPRLLERLPRGKSDIVGDLYLPLLEEGEALLGVGLQGAWYDFGSTSLYLESQLSMLASGSWGGRGRVMDPGATVHPRAEVTRSVVGPGTRVDRGARVVGSVLWDGVRVGEGAEVQDAIVTSGAWVRPHETIQGVVVSVSGGKSRAKRRRFVEVG